MKGYYDMPDATADTIDADGWLHSGDLGTMDERGYCRIEGRLKDMIIRGGENIYPREIEAVLFEHPAVADVAVVGVPDDTWGEQVAAFVRLADGASGHAGRALGATCASASPRYKAPRSWVFVDDVPADRLGQGAEVRPARAVREGRAQSHLGCGLRWPTTRPRRTEGPGDDDVRTSSHRRSTCRRRRSRRTRS